MAAALIDLFGGYEPKLVKCAGSCHPVGEPGTIIYTVVISGESVAEYLALNSECEVTTPGFLPYARPAGDS
jgi:hypothetical protein